MLNNGPCYYFQYPQAQQPLFPLFNGLVKFTPPKIFIDHKIYYSYEKSSHRFVLSMCYIIYGRAIINYFIVTL